MTAKADVRVQDVAQWNAYVGADVKKDIENIFGRVIEESKRACDWYWASSKSKRKASIWTRAISIVLLLLGAALPIVAAVWADPAIKLDLTQCGVAALATAGLLQAADRVFGWSSGWMRYITTALALEAATRKFQLDWFAYLLPKDVTALQKDDVPALFAIAREAVEAFGKLVQDETEKWVGEFSAGSNLLSDLIKTQRDSLDKAAEAANAMLKAKQQADEAAAKVPTTGAIQLNLTRKTDGIEVKIGIDDAVPVLFPGSVWSMLNIAPGQHRVSVVRGAKVDQRVVQVRAGEIAALDVILD